ncbi:MAG TPA: YHS domain-containing protein [Blastocatellia bacterium]|nr:YHS domain-containing protein [Blastocatellia bacterium]
MASQTDPVCGMQVDEKNAAGRSNFQGQEYLFCSQGCKNKFDQNPQQFASQSGQAQRGGQNR